MNYENYDPSLLPKIEVKRIRCIYFLYKGEEIVYIGQSINMFSRLFQHIAEKIKEFDSLRYMEVPELIDLDNLEKHLIIKYRPVYNVYIKFGHDSKQLRNNKELEDTFELTKIQRKERELVEEDKKKRREKRKKEKEILSIINNIL